MARGRSKKEGLSELEGAVLGAIDRMQPVTAYRLRTAFKESISTYWRAGAGAIYPLISKLVANGLVEESALESDLRGTKNLSISNAGRAALRAWIAEDDPKLGRLPVDPIRSRCQFISRIPNKDQITQIDRWIAQTAAAMADNRERIEALGDDYIPEERWALLGALAQLEARHDWLMKVKQHLKAGNRL